MRISFQSRLKRPLTMLLMLSLCVGAGASVFKILGRSWSGWVPVERFQWEKAYETDMTVSGKRVELQVYTARYDEPVTEQLKQAFEWIGAEVKASPSGNAGVAKLNGRSVSYMIVKQPAEPMQFIFLSYSGPQKRLPAAFPVPRYPNGEVLSSVSNEGTQTECTIVKTADSSTEIHEFYRHLLQSEGWVPVRPCTVDSGESKGLAVYRKRGLTCFIDVVGGKNVFNTVTLLVKKEG